MLNQGSRQDTGSTGRDIESRAVKSSCGQQLERSKKALKMEGEALRYTTCDRGPQGTQLTCSIDINDVNMKCKPGKCKDLIFPAVGLYISICPNGFSKEFKGLVCVGLKNIGRGEVKVDSIKITLGGLTILEKGGNIAAGQLLCRDSLASLDECLAGVKSGAVKWNIELNGLVRKQESKRRSLAKQHTQMEIPRKNGSEKIEKPWDLEEILKNLGESSSVRKKEKCVKPKQIGKKSKVKISESRKTAETGEKSGEQTKKKVYKPDVGEVVKDFKVKKEDLEATCWNCSVSTDVEKLFQCANCRAAWYCGVVCQREDWEKHWPWCQERQELRRRKKKGRDGEEDKFHPFSTDALASALELD